MYNEWNAQMKIVEMLQYLSKEHSKQLYIIDRYEASEEKLVLNGDFHHDYHVIFDTFKKYEKLRKHYYVEISDNTYQDLYTYKDITCSVWRAEGQNWHPWQISLTMMVPNFIYQYVDEKKLPVQLACGGYRERYDFDFSKKVYFEDWKLAVELIKDTQEKNEAMIKASVRNAKYAAIHSIGKDEVDE